MPSVDPEQRLPDRAVVWRLGDALLAAPLESVQEVAPVTTEGRARTRSAEVDLVVPSGLEAPTHPRHAVVLQSPDGVLAVPADEVEGVAEVHHGDMQAPPDWLRTLEIAHLRGVIRIRDNRVAALLDPARIRSG